MHQDSAERAEGSGPMSERHDKEDEIIAKLKSAEHCTVDAIVDALRHLEQEQDDDEYAHSFEDAARDAVLEAIANGAKDPHYLAAAIRETKGIPFSRWCA